MGNVDESATRHRNLFVMAQCCHGPGPAAKQSSSKLILHLYNFKSTLLYVLLAVGPFTHYIRHLEQVHKIIGLMRCLRHDKVQSGFEASEIIGDIREVCTVLQKRIAK